MVAGLTQALCNEMSNNVLTLKHMELYNLNKNSHFYLLNNMRHL